MELAWGVGAGTKHNQHRGREQFDSMKNKLEDTKVPGFAWGLTWFKGGTTSNSGDNLPRKFNLYVKRSNWRDRIGNREWWQMIFMQTFEVSTIYLESFTFFTKLIN